MSTVDPSPDRISKPREEMQRVAEERRALCQARRDLLAVDLVECDRRRSWLQEQIAALDSELAEWDEIAAQGY